MACQSLVPSACDAGSHGGGSFRTGVTSGIAFGVSRIDIFSRWPTYPNGRSCKPRCWASSQAAPSRVSRVSTEASPNTAFKVDGVLAKEPARPVFLSFVAILAAPLNLLDFFGRPRHLRSPSGDDGAAAGSMMVESAERLEIVEA